MSHGNIVAALSGISYAAPERIGQQDTYIAFLPLAHVLELIAEMLCMTCGARIGYGSPLTIRDDGALDAKTGQPKGDISALRPTVMAAVPLVMDRLKAAVDTQVHKSSIVVRTMFAVCYYLKRRAYLRGHSSPLLDKLVFNKIKNKFGGRLRYLLSGGAPLSHDTQEFMQIAFCCPVLQGYGLSETMGGGCVTDPRDVTTGRVGPPVACCEIRLEPQPDMGYTAENNSGEIWIRGANTTLGYWKLDEQTAESFAVTDDNPHMRWFKSGDIVSFAQIAGPSCRSW